MNLEQKNRVNAMSQILMRYQRHYESCMGHDCLKCKGQLVPKIERAVQNQTVLQLILPAFPAKSANPEKTLGVLPDRGEVMGLCNLNELCQALAEHHSFGIQLLICSDGRVFNDVVGVSDANVDSYQQGIRNIISEYRLDHLHTFSLDDVFPNADYGVMRELLMSQFAEPEASLRLRILEDERTRYQYNGMHRFIIEDQWALRPNMSKNQVRKVAKPLTLELIRRSNSWSALLAQYFPNALRLSIHPQPCGSEKLGIQFLPARNLWATPWHNVLLKDAQGWQLVKRKEAERRGAVLHHDHYVLEAV